jgi:hypothetical protein
MTVTAEQFVETWQKAKNVEEVCQVTGNTRWAVYARAVGYRKLGIPLKKFSTRGPIDVKGLAALAKRLG